jgi:hypothetical protein
LSEHLQNELQTLYGQLRQRVHSDVLKVVVEAGVKRYIYILSYPFFVTLRFPDPFLCSPTSYNQQDENRHRGFIGPDLIRASPTTTHHPLSPSQRQSNLTPDQ